MLLDSASSSPFKEEADRYNPCCVNGETGAKDGQALSPADFSGLSPSLSANPDPCKHEGLGPKPESSIHLALPKPSQAEPQLSSQTSRSRGTHYALLPTWLVPLDAEDSTPPLEAMATPPCLAAPPHRAGVSLIDLVPSSSLSPDPPSPCFSHRADFSLGRASTCIIST